jgi:hypothetical protein
LVNGISYSVNLKDELEVGKKVKIGGFFMTWSEKPPFFLVLRFSLFSFILYLSVKEESFLLFFFRYFHYIQAGMQKYVFAPKNDWRKLL